jgi:copper transport protein
VRRAAFLLVLLMGGWLLAGVASAPPASAHATLVSTDPAEGARLATAPSEVRLQFSEGVSLGAGYARVLSSDGKRADTGTPSVHGDVLTIPLRSGLPDDGYLVTYRVVSADSHPVSGAFAFVVGDGELPAGVTAAGERTDPAVAVALPAIRWLGFAGLALVIGLPVLALSCWPGGWSSGRLRRLATCGGVAVAGSAVAGFLLQGPYAAGSGLGSVLDPSLMAATASSEVGWALLTRAALAVVLTLVLLVLWRRGAPPPVPWVAGAGLLAAGLVLSTAMVGHPVAGPWPGLAVAVTSVHVAAMAVWLGGLTGLLAVVLRPATPFDDAVTALPRFSRLAFVAVVALVVTGTVQAVREVGSPTALFVTTYGWVLIAKLVLVVVALGAAGVSRVWVQQRLGVRRSRPAARAGLTAHAFAASAQHDIVDEQAGDRRRQQSESAAEHLPALRRSLLVEAGVVACILALSAVLVGTPPALSAVARPVDVLLPLLGSSGPQGSVQISVDPARPGPNTLHVYLFDDAGRLTQPAGIRVTLTEKQQGIGPLDVGLAPAGPGHYVADGLNIPGAGTWTLAVTVRLDEFTATTATTDFPVR